MIAYSTPACSCGWGDTSVRYYYHGVAWAIANRHSNAQFYSGGSRDDHVAYAKDHIDEYDDWAKPRSRPR